MLEIDVSVKRLDTRLRATENQRVDVMGTLVGIDGLEIHHVSNDMEFIGYAVTSVHIP